MEDKQFKDFVNSFKNLAIIVLLVILILILWRGCNDRRDAEINQNLINSMNDTITHWKDKDGTNHAKISVLTDIKAKDFILLETQQEDIMKLQAVVKEYKKNLKKDGSATIIETVTKYDTIKKIIYKDNFIAGKCDFTDSIINKWIWTKISVTGDSMSYNLEVKDDYAIIIGNEKDGLFKKKPFVEVTSKNPYSSVETLRTYQVPGLKPKKFGIGPHIGVGINQMLTPSVYVGVGININLIRF